MKGGFLCKKILTIVQYEYIQYMSDLFSVIIPTLNEEKYLPHILSDLASQKTKNFEVIIVDGESDDKTKDVAKGFQDRLPLQFFSLTKRNVSFQRNSGAKMAKGDYLVFIDADTRIPSDFTQNLEYACVKRGCEVVLPTIQWDDKSRKAKIFNSIVKSFIRASQVYGRPLSTGGNFAIEKHLFERIGRFNEHIFISEDHDLIRKAYDVGVKAKIVKNVKVTISMRRGALEGDASLIYKYVLGFLAYTMSPNEKTLKKKLFEYEMGGHLYESTPLKKKRLGSIDMKKIKQFLQMSAFVALVKFLKLS